MVYVKQKKQNDKIQNFNHDGDNKPIMNNNKICVRFHDCKQYKHKTADIRTIALKCVPAIMKKRTLKFI